MHSNDLIAIQPPGAVRDLIERLMHERDVARGENERAQQQIKATLRRAEVAEKERDDIRNRYARLSFDLNVATAALDEARAACDEAHQLLWHYDLAARPYGVDWGPVEMLRQRALTLLAHALERP